MLDVFGYPPEIPPPARQRGFYEYRCRICRAFILYVSDAPESARFYSELFDMQPSFEDPGFVAFDLAGGVQLALWSGASRDLSPSRTNELCLTLGGGAERIDRQFRAWANENVEVVEEPHDAVFGRTFVISDPDGNLVRVAPVD